MKKFLMIFTQMKIKLGAEDNMLDISKEEAKYIVESQGAIVIDLDELFAEGILEQDETRNKP